MLLHFPIISATSVRVTENPISSKAAKSISTARSNPFWRTELTEAPARCLRKSIQNMGETLGFSNVSSVMQTLALDGFAEKNSLFVFPAL